MAIDIDNIQISVIFDDRHPDGNALLLEELRSQGITNYILRAAIIDQPTVVESINASHKILVREAKERNKPCAIIFEQDIQFTRPGGWARFIAEIPETFDLYMGGTYGLIEREHVVCPIGLHCYIIAQQFFDNFLSVPDNQHIDTALEGKGNFRVCYPMVALQRAGYSFNNAQRVDYNIILPKEHIW